MREENSKTAECDCSLDGSSPHAWGKHRRNEWVKRLKRIIPTCVGKTQEHPRNEIPYTDHPHMRGENLLPCGVAPAAPGSSPHAWGKLIVGQGQKGSRRIIPTCVGKTVPARNPVWQFPDHPHMRGENFAVLVAYFWANGSSPHAWGKPWEKALAQQIPRIIPTCVGKTSRSNICCMANADHPHMRGENFHTP